MKKYLLLIIYNISLIAFCSAQNTLVKQWDKRFGGTQIDQLTCFQQTKDGGYILGGFSYSDSSGDKSQPTWDTIFQTQDYWIVKIDALGNKQWDKDFGGFDQDWFPSCIQTQDGGYLVGGTSWSGIGGDKTQPSWGGFDYWIVKTDSLGNKQWDKDFGGTAWDELQSLQQTPDGGYILGGYSGSGISGDKTQTSWGSYDYWIVKTDSLGNKLWDKGLGGTDSDILISLQQTTDGGFILGGYSWSDSSGDKTQNNWGSDDYWIVKIDSLGNKQWDKDFGGIFGETLHAIQQTTDGGYILGGFSNSGISGDKTQACWGGYYCDYWIIKIDSLGNKQWDKDFGGTKEDYLLSIHQTTDGGYIAGGYSHSDSSGNKSENNPGIVQTWVTKLDSSGNLEWDKTIFTTGGDETGLAIQTNDGCYAIANWTYAGIGGYKTQPSQGNYDYWIVKFCDSTLTTAISPTTPQPPEGGVVIAPNPFTDELTITFQKQNIKQATFTVKNILGQTVFSLATPNSQLPTKLDLSFLTKGIYFLEATIDGERTVKKIVKQ